MTRWKLGSSLVIALTIAVVAVVVAQFRPTPASADIDDYSQVVKLRREMPLSGSYRDIYRDVLTSKPYACGPKTCYSFVRGTIYSQLRTYRVDVEMRRYAMYVVTADIKIDHIGMTQAVSNLYFNLSTPAEVVAYSDTSSKAGPSPECRSVQIGLSKSIGPFDVGAKLGKLETCSTAASLSRLAAATNAVSYKATHFHKINRIRVARVVKVRSGTTPRFRLNLQVRKDSCLETQGPSEQMVCTQPGETRTDLRTYRIGTSPQ